MGHIKLFRITVLGAGLAGAGNVMAEEVVAAPVQERLQWAHQFQIGGDEAQDAFRKEVQMRIRNLNQEERTLMQDTGYNGRARLSGESAERGEATRGQTWGDAGGSRYYGRGFESRQLPQAQSSAGVSSSSGAATRAGQGGGAGSSRGKGR